MKRYGCHGNTHFPICIYIDSTTRPNFPGNDHIKLVKSEGYLKYLKFQKT